MLAYSLKLKILILIRWVWYVYLTVISHFLFVWRLNLCCAPPPPQKKNLYIYSIYTYCFIGGAHRLGKFIFHKFVGTDICCGHSWQFLWGFFKSCSYRYRNYIVSIESKEYIVIYILAISSSPTPIVPKQLHRDEQKNSRINYGNSTRQFRFCCKAALKYISVLFSSSQF